MNESISQQTKSLLLKHGFHLKKSLGQNLLIDPGSLNRIIGSAGISEKDIILEIGTGTGILTKELAKKAKRVISCEIDKRIFEIANEYLAGIDNVELRNEDFLKTDIPAAIHRLPLPIKVIANVPYYITTPIIEKLLKHKELLSEVILTVQREFAERMAAKPGTKDYGSFSVFVNYYTEPNILFNIPRSAFLPQPDVGSAVISLAVRKSPAVAVKDEKVFFEIVRAAFNQRRKTLKKALSAKFRPEIIENALSKSGIDGKRRGETLSIEEFAKISDRF